MNSHHSAPLFNTLLIQDQVQKSIPDALTNKRKISQLQTEIFEQTDYGTSDRTETCLSSGWLHPCNSFITTHLLSQKTATAALSYTLYRYAGLL